VGLFVVSYSTDIPIGWLVIGWPISVKNDKKTLSRDDDNDEAR